jgi:hypothetical protein
MRGDVPAGVSAFVEGLRHSREVRSSFGIAMALDCFADRALARGDPHRAAVLASAATRTRSETGGGPSLGVLGLPEPLEQAAARMEPDAFDAAVTAGRSMPLEDAVALVLDEAAEHGTVVPR